MRGVSYIYMKTTDGQQIKLELMDVQLEQLEEQVIQIAGKSYDIFAVPVKMELEKGKT